MLVGCENGARIVNVVVVVGSLSNNDQFSAVLVYYTIHYAIRYTAIHYYSSTLLYTTRDKTHHLTYWAVGW